MKKTLAVLIVGIAMLSSTTAHALPTDPQPVYGVWDSVVRTGQAAADYATSAYKYLYSYGWTVLQGVW